jgi:DNA-binding NtrC family response regulator
MSGTWSSSSQSLASGREVLVVEDDPRVRKMLADALKQMSFNATFAFSAEGADKLLRERGDFDILILDLNLPGMNGIDFLQHIRGRGCEVPVIILTGFGDLEAAKKAIHFDVVEFLSKPCTLGSLETAMSRARRRRQGQIVGEAAGSVDPGLTFDEPTTPAASPAPTQTPDDPADLSMEAVERRHILAVLAKHDGNRTAAAAELGISVRKLYYRLGEYQRKGLSS